MNEDMALMLITGERTDELVTKALEKGYFKEIGVGDSIWYHTPTRAWELAHEWRIAEIERLSEEKRHAIVDTIGAYLSDTDAQTVRSNIKKLLKLRKLKPNGWKV